MLWMLAATLFLPTQISDQSSRIELYKGCKLSGHNIAYWAVTDTTLDSINPDKFLGGQQSLPAGIGKAVLIRFGDLNRAIGKDKQIQKASIKLIFFGTTRPVFREAGVMLQPWGEGPIDVQAPWIQPELDEKTKLPLAPRWASNWKVRRSGETSIAWQQPGASGSQDYRPLEGVKVSFPEPGVLELTGFEKAVQKMLDEPHHNHGFILRFDGLTEFLSSQSPADRPQLDLTISNTSRPETADISVSHIELSPQFERPDPLAKTSSAPQAGVDIIIPLKQPQGKRYPSNGETVTATAYLKNQGATPINGYAYTWSFGEKPSILTESDRVIAPGEVVKITSQFPYREFHRDHRVVPLRFTVQTTTPEKSLANNSLEIATNGLQLQISLSESLIKQFPNDNYASAEDWLQDKLALLNESVFGNSVSALAPSGCLERIRIQQIRTVSQAPTDKDFRFDGQIYLRDMVSDEQLFQMILTSMGLPDLNRVKPDGYKPDPFGGLLGGDTRNTSYFPPQVWLLYEPVFDLLQEAFYAERTDLLSSIHVLALNDNLGNRSGLHGGLFHAQPSLTLIQIKDRENKPIRNAQVEFYQLTAGKLDTSKPTFVVNSGDDGTLSLPKNPVQTPDLEAANGQKLGDNAFGRLAPDGSNGSFWVSIKQGNQVASTWLHAWQMSEAWRRNRFNAFVATLKFDFAASATDLSNNIAKGKIVTDSIDSLPAKLNSLVDDSLESSTELQFKKEGWIEIDLGRDRVISEIQIFTKNMWDRFDVMIYSTGQTIDMASLWYKELYFDWNSSVSSGLSKGVIKAAPQRVRFIRLVNRSQSARPIQVHEIKIFPIVVPTGSPLKN